MKFILVIAGTNTIQHSGISAAGASHEELQYTAALDAEFLVNGKTSLKGKLPFSPEGIISPVIFTRAAVELEKFEPLIINAGSHHKPDCEFLDFKSSPSADIASGQAMPIEEVYELFYKTKLWAEANLNEDFVLAECVVAGTTTAQAVLKLLGFQTSGLVSSSFPSGNKDIKSQVIEQAVSHLPEGWQENIEDDPLYAFAYVGDAMQVVFCALAQVAAAKKLKVIFAGGTQMLAIKAVLDRLDKKAAESIFICPSPWLVDDESSCFMSLKEKVSPNTKFMEVKKDAAATLKDKVNEICKRENLAISFDEIITAYNQGHVKEGVGLGLALLRSIKYLSDFQQLQ